MNEYNYTEVKERETGKEFELINNKVSGIKVMNKIDSTCKPN